MVTTFCYVNENITNYFDLIDALHFDVVRGFDDFKEILAFSKDKILSLGVVEGRNTGEIISNVFEYLKKAKEVVGDRLDCSKLFIIAFAITLKNEDKLDDGHGLHLLMKS